MPNEYADDAEPTLPCRMMPTLPQWMRRASMTQQEPSASVCLWSRTRRAPILVRVTPRRRS
jgi:hypothetical protein